MLEALKRPLRSLRDGWMSRRRQAEIRSTAPHTTRSGLAADLNRLGIERGDVVFLHSSLKSLGFVEGGAPSVIGALLDVLGPEGSLMLPAYWLPGGNIKAACETPGYIFDPREHGTHMGALPEAVLAWQGVHRSVHPTHSVAAIGAQAAWLTEAHHLAPSVFGTGSPWERFAQLPQGKVLGLGISMGPVTFYHLLEDQMGDAFPVKVWMPGEFRMPCRDLSGATHHVPIRAYDPAVTARRIDHKSRGDLREWMAAEMDRSGIRAVGMVGAASSWWISGHEFLEKIRQMALRGHTIYAESGELPDVDSLADKII